MAIQTVNTGAAVNDGTGDDARTAFTKINSNFTDSTNTASKLLGTANGQVPLAEGVYAAAFSRYDGFYDKNAGQDCNTFAVGTRYFVANNNANSPATAFGEAYYYIETIYNYSASSRLQVAYGYTKGVVLTRVLYSNVWSAWTLCSQSPIIYATTTASSPNVFVTSTGELQRSTSSERYKDIVGDLTLDDVAYKNAMNLKPIIYRSTTEADNPDWHYYSFSAEKLSAYDKAFTLWRNTEEVTDENGVTQTVPLAAPVAEGINLNAIVAFLHATNVKQGKLINALTARIKALENA